VVSIEDYKHRGPRFDSRALLRIFLRELGLERGPLSIMEHSNVQLNVAAEWSALLLHIWEVMGSDLNLETNYTD
jgi:hypothetical protein